MPRFLCQNWQSAAPPAIVPSMCGFISIIFFTDCDAENFQKIYDIRICLLTSKDNETQSLKSNWHIIEKP